VRNGRCTENFALVLDHSQGSHFLYTFFLVWHVGEGNYCGLQEQELINKKHPKLILIDLLRETNIQMLKQFLVNFLILFFIYSFCPTVSEVDAGGIAVEVEPFHQYFVTFCCRVTDDSRGAVWKNGVWHGSATEAKMYHRIHRWKSCSYWHSLTIAEHLWRPHSGCEHSEEVGVRFSAGDSDVKDKLCSKRTCRILPAGIAGSCPWLLKMYS